MTITRRPALANDLLAVKLAPPSVGATQVARPALLARIGAVPDGPVTVLRAPAGFGKSSLAAHWAAASPVPVAWVSLDGGDVDPLRFWRYVLTACRAFDPGVGMAALAELRHAAPEGLEPVLTTFLNDLQALDGPHVLVLDDLQVVAETPVMGQLAWLIAHQPGSLRLILSARQEPALGLARLRARGDLVEITEADLRFTLAEVAVVIAAAGRTASTGQVQALAALTGGWPAAVRLLAVHPTPPEAWGAATPASLADFVAEEVLDAQPAAMRDFLLRVGVLPALTGDLCDAVTGRADGDATLAALERQGLFLEALDGLGTRRWFRFQRLFAEALRLRATTELGTAGLQATWAAAGAWYARQGQLEAGVDAYLAAGALEPAAALVDQIVEGSSQYDGRRLIGWAAHFPVDVLRRHPRLAFEIAQMRLYTLDRYAPTTVAAVEESLALPERAWSEAGDRAGLGRVALLRASLAFWQGDVTRAVALARSGLPLLAPEDFSWRGIALSYLGGDAIFDGRPLDAQPLLLEAATLCEIGGNHFARFGVLDFIGAAALQQAEPLQAEHHYLNLLRATETDDMFLDDRAHARLGLARVCLERNELEAADEHAAAALAIADHLRETQLDLQGTLLSAAVAQAQARSGLARSRLDALEARTQRPIDLREVRAAQAALALANEDLVAVRRWRTALRAAPVAASGLIREREAALVCRLLARDGDLEAALSEVDRLRAAAAEAGRARSELSLLVLRAALLAAARPGEAQAALLEALAIAQPRSLRRVFLDEGRALARLLQATVPRLTDRAVAAFAGGLLRAFPAADVDALAFDGVPLAEPLSPQERRVLRLLSAGLANAEIARELVVSPNTIKTQLQSLYRKLGVGSRRDAVAAARELDLL